MGSPVDLKGASLDADTNRIMKGITELLPPEAHEKRTPTAEELANTYPPGKAPTSGEHENDRRPGKD